jgi:hypothetical protein
MSWFRRLKPLRGLPTAHIEPAGNGYTIIEAARAQGLSPREIDTKWVELGKDGRALVVEPHATGGRFKLGRSALDKRTSYRGVVANHLVLQVAEDAARNPFVRTSAAGLPPSPPKSPPPRTVAGERRRTWQSC